MILIVKSILNSTNALIVEQGNQLAFSILEYFNNYKEVILDFSSINIISAVFLNTLINKLRDSYSNEFITKYLKYSNTNDKFLLLIRLVEKNIYTYYGSNVLAKVISNIEV